jgi:hypothetical protein
MKVRRVMVIVEHSDDDSKKSEIIGMVNSHKSSVTSRNKVSILVDCLSANPPYELASII